MPEIEVVCDACGEPLDSMWDYPGSGLSPTLRICPCENCAIEVVIPDNTTSMTDPDTLRRLSEGW